MTDTKLLKEVIERYYLGGIIEATKWSSKEETLNIAFIPPNKDMVGMIEADIDFPEGIIGISNTSQLLKMLDISDKDIDIKVVFPDGSNNRFKQMLIEDSNYSFKYSLSDINIMPKIPKINEPDDYEIQFPIDVDFITTFNKAKKALDSNIKEICTFSTTDNKLKCVLGEPSSHSHKIEFNITPTILNKTNKKKYSFNSVFFREILAANKADLISGSCSINSEGLLKLEFNNNKVRSTYFLIQLSE